MDTEKDKKAKADLIRIQNVDAGTNVGTGPVKSIPDGGLQGEAKQPKENTGNLTEMGGSSGGTSKAETEKKEAE